MLEHGTFVPDEDFSEHERKTSEHEHEVVMLDHEIFVPEIEGPTSVTVDPTARSARGDAPSVAVLARPR